MEFNIAKGLTRALTRAKDEDELLPEVAGELLRDSDADSVDILLKDDGEGLVLRASTMSPEFVYRLKLGKGVGLCGEVMASGEPLLVSQGALKMPKYASYPGIDGRESEALYICPIIGLNSKPVGVVEFGKGTVWKI